MDWQRLIDPRAWVQNQPTNLDWDRILNEQLDKNPVIKVSPHTVRVGGLEVWVSNYPYDYGNCYKPYCRYLPTMATRRRLKKLAPEYSNSEIDRIRGAL